MSEVALERVAQITARIGRILLTHGADTRHTQGTLTEVARALGHTVQVVVTADALLITAGADAQFQTTTAHVLGGMTVDMGTLIALQHVIDAICDGSLALPLIDARLDGVERATPQHSAWCMAVGVAITAGSLARLFGAEWSVVAAAFVAGLFSALLRRVLGRYPLNAVAVVFITALLSGLCSILVLHGCFGGVSPVLCLTAAGMILVPGVPLINGVRDLVSGHPGNGLARIGGGSMTVLVIGFAVFLAAAVAGDSLPIDSGPGALPLGYDMLFAATAAAGYALFFNVPWRLLWVCMLCGVASHGVRTLLQQHGFDLAIASLLGAFAAGVVALIVGLRLRVPAVAFAFPGIVALVPGSYGFRASVGSLELMSQGANSTLPLIATTTSLVITTVIVSAAIAVGLLLALAVQPKRPSTES
ncbi:MULTISPECIES: threonine/serine exporter ThrE family protein [unclassified Pseudomonas]|uniref:threonine/serine ThrE exporter family protein n=1 Tax=unclassified Pseudomonas TaxID=196821 RepID=UPI0015A4DC00|nr:MULTISPECIES: threonine/serine exporter family protein [unclassified Pseudomonas]NWC92980.1 threonine/serine exporter family protein [Pseudomonas sp. IPO3779]NWD19398.1 threonine/serine exporter family protein [Pseudomonas sp. IPO3778]